MNHLLNSIRNCTRAVPLLAMWSTIVLAQSGDGGGIGRVCGTQWLALRAAQLQASQRIIPQAAKVDGNVQQPSSIMRVQEIGQIEEITVGTQLSFPISGSPILLQATCQHVGENSFVFVEDRQWDTNGGSVLQSHVDGIGELFDRSTPADPSRGVFELSSEAFGDPPDVDGHQQIFILILDIADPVFIGYFDPAVAGHPVPELRRDVIYLDERAVRRSSYLARGTLAHEFQHLIHWGHDPDEESWINEGLSGYAEELTGFPEADPAAVPAFLTQPDVDFTNWPARAPPAYYGSTYLLSSFLAERFGKPFIRDLVAQPRNGRFGIDDAFAAGGLGEDFDSAWGQWVVANYVSGGGHASYSAIGERSSVAFPVDELPLIDAMGEVRGQWGTATILFRTPGDLSIDFVGGDSGRFKVWAYVMRAETAQLMELDLDGEMRATTTVTNIDSLALIVGKTSFQGGDYTVSANRPLITAISERVEAPSLSPQLSAPFPNPFNGAVTIRFNINARSAEAQLAVYAVNGQRLRRWPLGNYPAGANEIVWDGRDQRGRTVASGTYSIELKVDSGIQRRRLTLLK
jgi:hypothetical protein